MSDHSSQHSRQSRGPLRRLLLACGLGTASLLAGAAPPPPLPAEASAAGLVAVDGLIPDLHFDVRYATANNFVGRPLYPGPRCWLQQAVAERLARVQAALKGEGLGLKVFDCYRPFSVQEQLWTLVPDERYVGKPSRGADGAPLEGSRHNRGAAVDLSLVDLASGEELAMPTDYDDFSERAHRDYRQLDAAVLANRARLEAAMAAEGFSGLPTEWWHFDAPGWERYPLLDIPLR
ncbi:MAG: M15 family metallopeptidase [Porticoccaceae bacterium]|jgi:beta-N-acetylhexosaminidase/D-alanyl-D-alanine dipeptidase|nr:M15 family metallopeptidase [Porticoccaceae bacterium]HLS98219.1 M15 family metallopeptidase [Porticoccaceae bacterium]